MLKINKRIQKLKPLKYFLIVPHISIQRKMRIDGDQRRSNSTQHFHEGSSSTNTYKINIKITAVSVYKVQWRRREPKQER